MIGNIYGKLTVIASATKIDKHLRWECLCLCGNKTIVRGANLKTKKTVSCGCYQKEKVTIHGGRKTRLYLTWTNMKRRCLDKKAKDYKHYGQRGIVITPLWLNFANFKDWAIASGYKDNLTIDRKNVDGNYEPSNCMWSDWHTQACNQRKEINKSSIYLGVSKRKHTWEASVKRFGKNYTIGNFLTELEAAKARDAFVVNQNWPHKLNF